MYLKSLTRAILVGSTALIFILHALNWQHYFNVLIANLETRGQLNTEFHELIFGILLDNISIPETVQQKFR